MLAFCLAINLSSVFSAQNFAASRRHNFATCPGIRWDTSVFGMVLMFLSRHFSGEHFSEGFGWKHGAFLRSHNFEIRDYSASDLAHFVWPCMNLIMNLYFFLWRSWAQGPCVPRCNLHSRWCNFASCHDVSVFMSLYFMKEEKTGSRPLAASARSGPWGLWPFAALRGAVPK